MSAVAATLSKPNATLAESGYTGYIGEIPVWNLWLLMRYASELFRQLDQA